MPTPPPTPQISTVSPAWSLARVASMCQTVRVARGNAAASDHDIPSGTRPRFAAGTTTSSAAVPGRCSPRMPKREQSDSSPASHAGQCPQEIPGLISTRSPGRHPRTAGPTVSTSPAPSDPTTCGKTGLALGRPPVIHRSIRFRAAQRTRTSTSSSARSAGAGRFRTSRCSRPPMPVSVRALIGVGSVRSPRTRGSGPARPVGA